MSWELFVVKGDKDVIRGFVHGFAAGAGSAQAVYCEAELPLERASLARLLLSGPHHRVLVQARFAEKLAAALESAASELSLELQSRKPVSKLRFVAKAEAFSPEVAASLQEKLFHPPAGVAVEHKQEEKQTDRTARGAELYAPVHHFQYRAEVHYAGEVEGILALHRALAATDFVEVSPVEVA
jgi:hypothetical protein